MAVAIYAMRIAEKSLGPGHPVFIAAELGVTACGSLKRAFALIDACAEAKIDACKFIVTDPDKIMRGRDKTFTYEALKYFGQLSAQPLYEVETATRPLYDLLGEMKFTFDEWVQVRGYCHTKGLIFFATADHLDAVDMLELLQVPAYKLSAWDIAYWPLIDRMIATKRPVLVDVGTAT